MNYADKKFDPLVVSLSFAVSMWIKRLQKRGRLPKEKTMQKIFEKFSKELGEHGDKLLNPGRAWKLNKDSPYQPARMFNKLACVIALLSFEKGGIEIFGIKFESFLEE